MRALEKNKDLKTETKVEIGKYLTESLLNKSKMRESIIREIGIKEKYYKEKVEYKIMINEL